MNVWDYVLISIALALMLAATCAVFRALFIRSASYARFSVDFDEKAESALLKLLAFDTSRSADVNEAREKLTEIFPEAFSRAESLSENALLYRWGNGGKPRLFVFHIDTAPFDVSGWKYSPLGEIVDDAIYGRGALDDKGALCAALCALCRGEPSRELYMYIATDEERGGDEFEIVLERLKKLGKKPEYVADEGGFVAGGDLCGFNAPAALTGVSKTVSAEFPPSEFDKLNKTARKIRLPREIVKSQSSAVIPYCDFPAKVVCGTGLPTAKRELLKSLLPCACDGAFCEKDSNCARIVAADEKSLRKRLKKLGLNVQNISEIVGGGILPETASADLRAALARSFGNIPVIPYLTHGETESDKFRGFAPALKFVPIAPDQAGLSSVHSENERISRENLARAALFYEELFGIEV